MTATGDDVVLRLRDVRIHDGVGDREVVHGVSFELKPGKVVGIVGESGSGKTLTCRAVLGILPEHFTVSGGSIELVGRDVAGLSTKEWTSLRGATVSAVFQDPASYLNPSIRVGAQIAEVIRVKLGLGRRAARHRAIDLLAAVRLREPELVYYQYPHELSGGMLQRVLIAVAIAADPQVLLADEATTALDVTVQAEILDLLADLCDRTGLALVVVSHDLAVVAQLCDEVLVLRDGDTVEQGPTAEILFQPRHSYTRMLIAEHNQYGLDRFLDTPEPADDRAGRTPNWPHPSRPRWGAKCSPSNAGSSTMPAEPTPQQPVLEVTGLEVHYRRRHALRGATLSVAPGEAVGLIGETGSGKSTLARAVVGLVRASGGRIVVAGEDVTKYSARQWRALRRRGVVQYVFQDPLRSLDPDLTIEESIVEPLLIQGRPRAEAAARARAYLARVHLDEELLSRLPGELSGGQRQRVTVARALVTEPQLILLDEPVSALDSANRVQALEILKELRDSGAALLFISHDLGSVAGVADRIAVLYQGEVVEVGAARTVVNEPRHAYTRLLVGSAPTLRSAAADRARRDELRALLHT